MSLTISHHIPTPNSQIQPPTERTMAARKVALIIDGRMRTDLTSDTPDECHGPAEQQVNALVSKRPLIVQRFTWGLLPDVGQRPGAATLSLSRDAATKLAR
jgi:hypothetical protein